MLGCVIFGDGNSRVTDFIAVHSLFAAWSAPEIISVVLNRAHGHGSHPVSLHYNHTMDPLLVTQGFNICF